MKSVVKKSRGTVAKEYFMSGYNCSQAVTLAFADLIPIEKDILLKLSSSFGGGMGRLREVCGSVSGMFMVMGMLTGYTSAEDKEVKAAHYAHIQELAHRFEAENGSIICRELLGLSVKREEPTPETRTEKYYKKRPCAELCECSADILEKYLTELEILK